MSQTEETTRFRTDNRQTKEEFLAQFTEQPENITVKIQWTWEKGSSRFTSFDGEELAHVRYIQPWEADGEHPIGIAGTIYWFCRRKLLGYPYPPRFNRNECYRLRVRRCREKRNFFLLERVLESKVDVAEDAEIYRKVLNRYNERFTGEKKEILIHCANDTDVSKVKRADGMAIGYAYIDYSAVIDEPGTEPKMVGRTMLVPFNDKDFSDNRQLKFRKGCNYRILADIGRNSQDNPAFGRLLASDVVNEPLTNAGREALKPAKWHVEGYGDFDIVWDRFSMKASSECVQWNQADPKSEISVYLECDPDNCHTAYKTTAEFLAAAQNREAFEKKIFEAAADSLSDENGMVETWDEETGTITREEMLKRLTLEYLSFEKEGIDIMLGLDDLFTDHAYSMYMKKDGSLHVNGLWG